MKRLLLTLLLSLSAACSILPDIPFTGGGEEPPAAPQTAVGEVLHEAEGLLIEIRWWALLAVLFFPAARTAVGQFLAAVFSALAVPFKLIREKFEKKA